MIIKTYEIGEALYEVTYIMEENISNKSFLARMGT